MPASETGAWRYHNCLADAHEDVHKAVVSSHVHTTIASCFASQQGQAAAPQAPSLLYPETLCAPQEEPVNMRLSDEIVWRLCL